MNQWDADFRRRIRAIRNELPGKYPRLLHIGGHVGQEAGFYVSQGYQVSYCEPVPEFADILRKKELNLTVYQCAVGEAGIVTMYVNNQESSIMSRKKGSRDKWTEIDVLSVPLASLQLARNFDVLVIDAQGATMKILKSGSVKRFGWVIAEGSHNPVYKGEQPVDAIVKYMNSKGFYELDRIPHGEKDIIDLVFVNGDRK